jgi:hypothetical protein
MALRYALTLALVLGSGAPSVAADPTPAHLVPIEVPLPLEYAPIGVDHGAECLLVYTIGDPGPRLYFPAGAGVEAADDLFTVATGSSELCAFEFAYYSAYVTDVVFTFYENTGSTDPPGAIVAGPFAFSSLPIGLLGFRADVPGGTIGPDIWVGAEFSTPLAGLLVSEVPWVGTSGDGLYVTPPGVYTTLTGPGGAVVKGNLWLSVFSSPAVQTEVATWGRVKAIHR